MHLKKRADEQPTAAANETEREASNKVNSATAPPLAIECNASDALPAAKLVKEPICGPPTNYCNRRSRITTDRMNELRRRAQDAVKQNKTFTIRGCFNSVRNALTARGWVEKLDVHRKHVPTGVCQVTFDDLAQGLPKRKPGETRRQYQLKCERNIMSRFLEHMPIDFLWTNRKEKCDYIDQAKNPGMVINKFHRAPFTSKEGLCSQLKDFHWFYEEGTAEMYFPRCFNVWSLEELGEFLDSFKLTACIAFMRLLVDRYREHGFEAVFSPAGRIPFTAIDFAQKRCAEFIDSCQHKDIDVEDPPKLWEHDWDAFLQQQNEMACEGAKILADPHRLVEGIIKSGLQTLECIQSYWPQYSLDGYQNLWIIKPANKCRGRGIQLLDNIKKILAVVNPSIASKSRYVVQKYIERPLIIHNTKFDIRQWFLITNVQPLVVWMYKDSYLRFSSQEYNLKNHHESVHLTNYAIQKKYTNGKRDKRLPNENMWDCYSFQAYLRQIGKQDMWFERIYPGMRKAIIGTMLASQENMDRRPNTFELFGADFMICEDFYPWLIEINSSPDLGATTSVTARLCPQCLEDVIKVVIDRRGDLKADPGNFELIYRQVVPPTPAYMGLNLYVKGKQIMTKVNYHHHHHHMVRKERTLNTSNFFRQRTALIPAVSSVHRVMPTFNATEYMEKCLTEVTNSCRSSVSGTANAVAPQLSPFQLISNARQKLSAAPATPCPNLLRTPRAQLGTRRSYTSLTKANLSDAKKPPQPPQAPVPIKRHRSCGPCLAATPTEGEKKFKFIIKKCTLQKNAISSGQLTAEGESAASGRPAADESPMPLSSAAVKSKSEDNIIVLQKLKCQLACAEQLLQHARQRRGLEAKLQAPWRSCSSILEKKRDRVLDKPVSDRCSRKSYMKRSDTRSDERRAEPKIDMHAVGRGLVTWKAAGRSACRMLSTTRPSSVYTCKSVKVIPAPSACRSRRTRRYSESDRQVKACNA